MPKLITVQISRCPECGEDNWLLWELDVGEDASSIAKVEDEYRTAANVRRSSDMSENHWKATFAWPFKLF